MVLKKEFDIVVCGDSFSSATKNGNPRNNARDHYSQILQDQYGYSVLCLARSSMTNLGIAWQMRQAIKIGCKFLLYHNTWSYRLNLLINDNFQVEKGLKNFIYPFKDDESSHSAYVGHNPICTSSNGVQAPNNDDCDADLKARRYNASILSTVPQGLENNPTLIITKEQHKAIEYYFKHFFNEALNQEVDSWILAHWHHQAEKAGIVPIDMKLSLGRPMFDYQMKGKMVGDTYIMHPDHDDDRPFHTDQATQQTVADAVHMEIQKLSNA
jgi:hypothetical protein